MKPLLHSGYYRYLFLEVRASSLVRQCYLLVFITRPSHRLEKLSWVVAGCCSWLKTEFGCLVVTDILRGQRVFFWGQRVQVCLQEKRTGLQNSFLHHLFIYLALNLSRHYIFLFHSMVSLCSNMFGSLEPYFFPSKKKSLLKYLPYILIKSNWKKVSLVKFRCVIQMCNCTKPLCRSVTWSNIFNIAHNRQSSPSHPHSLDSIHRFTSF